ncbi:hypothetical protein Taro_017099 [Colocasia esculenta]|uniref:WDR11 first beta-propeller domain-containing protein n=1 Tax=Colocasia esculenta TaxID=4460 RepID=A0A843UQB5_COLES|nr:hypothetical protein [Colocasia esculenta]
MAASAASSTRGHHESPPRDSWDSMLPGPPSRDNGGGCADLSAAGLLAYGAGSSVVVADPRSMQLVSVLPMPAPSRAGGSSPSSGLAPFVTSVRWTPQPLPRDLLALDEPSTSHLRLAVGDRQGRIAIWDFRFRRVLLWLEFDASFSSSSSSSDRVKLGVQDLCWVRSDCWILASISGPSLVALWDTASGRCIWKYDASPEFLSCLRRDPFDARHFCTVGLRGFMLSAKVLGGRTGQDIDVFLKEHQVPGAVGDLAELQRIEREALSSGTASASAPAFAVFPHPLVRFCFSRLWRHILLVTFPREMILFDLQYGTSLSCMSMPRGCGKIMDVIADPDEDLAYCVHLDGKLSTWKRKK